MIIQKKWQSIALAAAIFWTLAVPAVAQDALQDLPEVMRQGDVTYMTGGVGLEERDAMKTVAKDYNLYISNANKYGKFTADVTVVIKDKNGKEVFTSNEVGPLLYVKLPAGSYTIEAKSGDEGMTRKVSVGEKKGTNVHFVWKNAEGGGPSERAYKKSAKPVDEKKAEKKTMKTKKAKTKKSSEAPVKEEAKKEKAASKDHSEKKEEMKKEADEKKEESKETKNDETKEVKKEEKEEKRNGWFKVKKNKEKNKEQNAKSEESKPEEKAKDDSDESSKEMKKEEKKENKEEKKSKEHKENKEEKNSSSETKDM